MCTLAASFQCILRPAAIHAVLVPFSVDPDILRHLVHLEEDREEDGVVTKADPL